MSNVSDQDTSLADVIRLLAAKAPYFWSDHLERGMRGHLCIYRDADV